jgi:predicted metal-dependent peptidase
MLRKKNMKQVQSLLLDNKGKYGYRVTRERLQLYRTLRNVNVKERLDENVQTNEKIVEELQLWRDTIGYFYEDPERAYLEAKKFFNKVLGEFIERYTTLLELVDLDEEEFENALINNFYSAFFSRSNIFYHYNKNPSFTIGVRVLGGNVEFYIGIVFTLYLKKMYELGKLEFKRIFGLIKHELMHILYLHHARFVDLTDEAYQIWEKYKDYIDYSTAQHIWNIACDIIINEGLGKHQLPPVDSLIAPIFADSEISHFGAKIKLDLRKEDLLSEEKVFEYLLKKFAEAFKNLKNQQQQQQGGGSGNMTAEEKIKKIKDAIKEMAEKINDQARKTFQDKIEDMKKKYGDIVDDYGNLISMDEHFTDPVNENEIRDLIQKACGEELDQLRKLSKKDRGLSECTLLQDVYEKMQRVKAQDRVKGIRETLRNFISDYFGMLQGEKSYNRPISTRIGSEYLKRKKVSSPNKGVRLAVFVDESGSMGDVEIARVKDALRDIKDYLIDLYYVRYSAGEEGYSIEKISSKKFIEAPRKLSGGTDLGTILSKIKDKNSDISVLRNADLFIIITDGYDDIQYSFNSS